MNKIVIFVIALSSAAAFAKDLPQISAGQNKDTVAVYMAGEEPRGALGSHKILGGELEKAISRSKNYIAVNRTEDVLDALSKEHSYSRSGAVNDTQIQKIGEQLGVRYLCIVETSEANRGYYVAARLVDVVSAKILKTSSTGSRLEDYNEQMAVAQWLARELTGVDLGMGRRHTSTYKSELKPKQKEKYPDILRRLENKISIEAGGALSLSSYSSSEIQHDWYFDGKNFYADYKKGGWLGRGGYLRLDLVCLELFADGIPYSESNTQFGSGGLLCKIPMGNNAMKLFPVFGVGAIADGAGSIGGPLILGGRIDIGSEIIYLRSEFLYASGNISDSSGSVMVSLKNGYARSLKIGGGLDIGLGYRKRAYLRPEVLYNYIETSGEYNSTRHDLNFRLGMGYKWGLSGRKKNPSYSQQTTPPPPLTPWTEERTEYSQWGASTPTVIAPPPPLAVASAPPPPIEDIYAKILIHSRPPEAEVYIGEMFIGKTNQPTKLMMPLGTYEVKFVKGDLEKTETMTFRAGENNAMKVVQLGEEQKKKKQK